MSKLLGFGLILTGMVIGGVGVPLSASSLAGREASMAAAPADASAPPSDKPIANERRGFATPALKPLTVTSADDVASATAPRALQAKPREPHPALRPPAAPVARKPIVPAFETVTVAEDPGAITRAVQGELARVGCYAGAATGVWGPDTRRAMKAFMHRVNATLPIEKPDVILLSLLRAQSSPVCGKACPTGQEGTADGRCLPRAVVAQAARKASPPAAKVALRAGEPAKDVHTKHGAVKPHVETKREVIVAAAPPLPAVPFVPIYSDAPRMALAGPGVTAEPIPVPSAVGPSPTEKSPPAKHVRKREHKEPRGANVSYGQTRWARDFFRANSTF